jgi:uncharacterized membrane protein YhiD involved in acid resistance
MPPLESLSPAAVSVASLLIVFGSGTLAALVLAWHFTRFSSTTGDRRQLARTFPFLLLTTILIVSVVKSSIALSLGLVGALSIVRFRTPVKEPEELAYLFLSIGIGVGLGAGQVGVTLLAAAFIGILTALLSSRGEATARKGVYLVVNWKDGGNSTQMLEQLMATVDSYAIRSELRRLDSRAGESEATLFVADIDQRKVSALLHDLRQLGGDPGMLLLDQSRFVSLP